MHISDSCSPYPHSPGFQFPLRIASLAGLSFKTEREAAHRFSVLMIVTGGSGTIEVNGQCHPVTGGSLLCSSSTRQIELAPQYSLQGVWIEYSALHPQPGDASPLNTSQLLGLCTSKAFALANRLMKLWREPSPDNAFTLQAAFAGLLEDLYSGWTEQSSPPEHWLDPVLQYIEDHYHEDLTRGQMAELAQVSPEHFSRTFRKATGQTFNEYLTLQRIRRVQQRMLTGALSLSALAQEVGYGEGTYLSRKFKQVVGLAPTIYLRKAKRIASLNFNHTASLRALHIMPELGVYSGWMKQLELAPSYPELRAEDYNGSALYRSVAAARPDVVISYGLAQESKHLLPVAPVIGLSYLEMDWREQFRVIAEITGRLPQAEALLSEYDELCYRANRELDLLIGRRGTAVAWEVGEVAYCYSSSYGHGSQILYGDLGFHPPAALLTHGLLDNGYLEATIGELPDYHADHIFITSKPSTPLGRQHFSHLLHSRRWQELQAVRSGRVYQLDESEMFYGFDPLSSMAQLKALMRAIKSQIYMGNDHIRP